MSNYERGLELIRVGEYFEAHEELEIAWRAAEPAERDFHNGIVHVPRAPYPRDRCHRRLLRCGHR